MNTVRDILDHKGKNVWSVSPQSTLIDALRLLRAHNVGALMVMEGEKVLGIISERDFAWKIAEKGACPLDQPVELWMTKEVLAVPIDATMNECMQLMLSAHIRHIPVVEDDELVGLVSIGDAVRAVISGQESTIVGLENYILSQNITL
ncbi:MAG TPA: CBS domain-containing protein [Anaerovoracaceae bacterium]|nr:CBS domain-containing protein [Anaerovoracaceae bacterium]